ncbi:MAG: hypothetical protein GWP05_02035 [Anaerolineaceae bacterium]|nr:hypothetical protein [Anaerolineaceae bacterium]
MRKHEVIIAALILAALAATALAQTVDWDDEPEDRNLSPEEQGHVEAARAALSHLPFDVRRSKTIPGDLRGSAVMVPLGAPKNGLRACLYVPSYYDPGRSWPLLVDGRSKHLSPLSLWEFHRYAEQHGFLMLSVEYLYFRGDNAEKVEVWTRRGEGAIQPKERRGSDFLRDMIVDEKNLMALIKKVRSRYNIEGGTIGLTGFLHSAIMAYRLTLIHPDTFCTAIARSGNFDSYFMPRGILKARQRPIFIVYGEKETSTLEDSKRAAAYFRRRGFRTVESERIPNSGVDSRPEIAANFFRGVIDEILGPEQTEFNRAYSLAVRCLNETAEGNLWRSGGGKPPSPAAALEALGAFVDKYPESKFKARCRFMSARISFEKLTDRKKAEALLREFMDQPLLGQRIAPQALLYLAERIIDPEADRKEALAVLSKIVHRRDAPAATSRRARKLYEQLLRRNGSADSRASAE